MSEFEYITAPTLDECVKKLQSLYGNNFTVYRKKWIKKGGFLGFFQHDEVQVSYIVTERTPNLFTASFVNRDAQSREQVQDFDTEREKILGLSRNPNGTYSQTAVVSAKKEPEEQEDPSYQKILDEMKSIRNDISEIKVSGPADEEPETIVKIRTILEDNEFAPVYVRNIIEKVKREFTFEGLKDFQAVERRVIEWIQETVAIDNVAEKEKAKVIILVGPTGVGKTTTVAKLAAKYGPPSQNQASQKKVHIITIDNFRIGGKEQIEKFASLMDMGVDSCKNADELEAKIIEHAPEVETILIDTIGYSPKDSKNIAKMKQILEVQGLKTNVYLAMMASTKASDMREIMKQYELFGYDDVIITKLDETGCVGNLISIVSEKNKKFAWYTTGQRVPVDIEEASVTRLTNMLQGFDVIEKGE